jgi:ketosteroid isomerase-like protein
MKNKMRASCFALMLLVPAGAALAQSPTGADRTADHEALRGLLAKSVQALNTRNFDAIAPSVHPSFTIITSDNRKHVGLDAFRKYYAGLFNGPDATLKNFETKVVADEETRFIDVNTGVVHGTSQDTYSFTDGDVRTMQTRWSAVTRKEGDGWQLVNVHFSSNVLENPVLDGTRSFYQKLAAGAAVVGLLLGILLTALLRRRPR